MLAGIIIHGGTGNAAEKLIKLADSPQGLAHISYDESTTWQDTVADNRVVLVQQRYWNAVASRQAKGMVIHTHSQTRIVAWARIDNRLELLNRLPADLQHLCTCDDGLILAAYLHWGEQACEYLIGDFAFAIYDGRDHSLYCGRDHTGVKPFYYYFDGKQFAFASSMAVLNQLPGLDLTLSQEWLARYLVNASGDWSLTTYRQIYKLPPAHTLKFSYNKVQLNRYFEFSPESDLILPSDQEYVDAYREVLHQAVSCRVQSDYAIGSESSGGLDSSTVTALASRYMRFPGKRLHAFGYDESVLTPECMIAISQTNPMYMTHFASRTRSGGDQLMQRFYQCHGAPIEHANGISHHMFYECAQALGIRTLLSGFGGDEFVTNAAPVALVELWRARQYKMFWQRQRGLLSRPLHTLRWLYQYYRFDNQSTTSRGLQAASKRAWSYQLLKQSVVDQYALQTQAAKGMIYDGGQTQQNGFSLNNRWSPMMTARYENCTLMAAGYGIDYRWPLMDIRLLKLFLSIPASQKLGPGRIGRYLHRRAVADILPEFICWKTKDMEPFKFWQRLGVVAARTPLVAAIKRATEPRLVSLKQIPPANPTDEQQQNQRIAPLQLHPIIEQCIDQDKLDSVAQMLRIPTLTEKQKKPMQRHIMQLRQLNEWLQAQES